MEVELKKVIGFMFFLILVHNVNSQNICLKIDSIKLYNVPLNLSTTLSLSAEDVRNFESDFIQITMVNDSMSISKFPQTFISGEFKSNNSTHIDARIVVDLYTNINQIITIMVNKYGFYQVGNQIYYWNDHLFDWIKSHIIGINFYNDPNR